MKLAFLLLAWLLAGRLAFGQAGLTLEPQATAVVDGNEIRVTVTFAVPAPWHINAHRLSDPHLIPTTLTWDASPDVQWSNTTYPDGKTVKVEWTDKPVELYEGTVALTATASVIGPWPARLTGRLRYQACDDINCYPPKTVPVTVATGEAGATAVVSAPAEDNNQVSRLIRESGWGWALFFVFLGGLGLNLTPCVYPMITITVGYFGGTGQQRSVGRAFATALVYCAGIVLTYSSLGLVAALTGSLFGALLQNPIVLILVAGLLVALALSMFGLYELQPPQLLMQRATGLSNQAGFVGVFFLGAMIGVVAAPCLAPFVVALLAFVAQTGSPWMGWWLFFVFACGLGIPYVVLATFSGLLHRLPKSGTWMVWVKRVMGVGLIAVAVWVTGPLWSRSEPLDPQRIAAQLAAAKAAGQPVLLDFYADWCPPCKEMERVTFPDPRVQERLTKLVFIKVDLTRTGSPDVEALMREYAIRGVPTYVFLDANGRELVEHRQVGFIAPEGFAALLDKVLAAAGTR